MASGLSRDSQTFLESAFAFQGRFCLTADIPSWIAECVRRQECRVTRIPLSDLPGWHFDRETGALAHMSGKFFTVRGLVGTSDYPEPTTFDQPIINQPEVGILGLLAKEFDGVLYFLLQAKMEAGNVNLVQLSPTVQATRSNYTQVHGGRRPRYLEYFTDRSLGRVVSDQLQSEQGNFFLGKRNRNIIVITEDDVAPHDDFCWLTLGQIKQLLQANNLINMDTRTVISAIPLVSTDEQVREWADRTGRPANDDSFDHALVVSSARFSGVHTTESVISWLTEIRATAAITTERVPLDSLVGWSRDDSEIRRQDGGFFSVIGVSVEANSREVPSWSQPIVKPVSVGLSAFLTKRIGNVLHFLVQARMEPGLWNQIELAPTVQYLPGAVPSEDRRHPPFFSQVHHGEGAVVRHDSIQSEEGGRFLHYQNRNAILELPLGDDLEVPRNYCWVTLGQFNTLMRYGNYLNIEARSLLACLALGLDAPSD